MAAQDKDKRISVLFVCLGNICRSPMASATFKHIVAQRGLSDRFDRIESAGTADYHVGEDPDERTTATCRRHGVPIDSVAQHADADLISKFDYVLGMDVNNTRNLEALKNRSKCKAIVKMFGDFDPNGQGGPIKDPYYEAGGAGFERCYEQILRYSDGLLAELGFPQSKV